MKIMPPVNMITSCLRHPAVCRAVDVQRCKNVTVNGVSALAKCPTMRSIGFSSSIAHEARIVELVQSATNITWDIDDDPAGKLDHCVHHFVMSLVKSIV